MLKKTFIQALIWFVCVCVCVEQVLSLPGLSSNITAEHSLVQMWQVRFYRSPRKVPQSNGKHNWNPNAHRQTCSFNMHLCPKNISSDVEPPVKVVNIVEDIKVMHSKQVYIIFFLQRNGLFSLLKLQAI